MTTYRIGQRVRIKHGINSEMRYLEGMEGVLLRRSAVYNASWRVDVDGNGSLLLNGVPYSIHEDHLEPLTDSNTLVSWESMRDLWVPEHLREAA